MQSDSAGPHLGSASGPTSGPAPQRVRVSASRRSAARHTTRPVAEELSDETDLGEVYVRGLIRAQLRLSASLLLLVALTLAGVPLLFLLIPETGTVRLGPVPLPWVLLGVAAYPAAWILARFYVRASERLEAAFVDLVNGD